MNTKARYFSASSVKHTNEDGESDGELSDHSETDVRPLDKEGLLARKEKLQGRLETSTENSSALCDHLETVTDELQNIVETNLGKLSKEDKDKLEQHKRDLSKSMKEYLEQWNRIKSSVGEVHDNHSSLKTNLMWSAWTKSLVERNLLDQSSRDKASIIVGESSRIRKDLETNSDNLIKDSKGLEKINSKLNDIDSAKNTGTSSLVDEYANPSMEMPSYMDPED